MNASHALATVACVQRISSISHMGCFKHSVQEGLQAVLHRMLLGGVVVQKFDSYSWASCASAFFVESSKHPLSPRVNDICCQDVPTSTLSSSYRAAT